MNEHLSFSLAMAVCLGLNRNHFQLKETFLCEDSIFLLFSGLCWFLYIVFLPATNICLLYSKLDLQNHSHKTTVLLVFAVTIPGGADLLHSPDNLWVILDVPLHCLFSHLIWCYLSIISPASASLEVRLLPHLPFCVLTVSSPHLRPFPVLVH